MINQLSRLSKAEQAVLRKVKIPSRVEPMLAASHDQPFSHPDWLFERKLEGERCFVFKNGKAVHLRDRNGHEISARYPELAEAIKAQVVKDCIIDGEVVAFSGHCMSSALLRKRLEKSETVAVKASGVQVYLYLFDLLYLEGHDITGLPLRVRKGVLKRAIAYEDPLRFTIHRNEHGTSLYSEACTKGWEGIMAKDGGAPYQPERSKSWLKLTCDRRQELVIGGWTEPKGNRQGFGALLLGYYQGGKFIYAGKVGTGFDRDTLDWLYRRMQDYECSWSPYDRGMVPEKGVHYIKPKLVAEVAFSKWTSGGKLRHPRFLGIRRDKEPRQVVLPRQ